MLGRGRMEVTPLDVPVDARHVPLVPRNVSSSRRYKEGEKEIKTKESVHQSLLHHRLLACECNNVHQSLRHHTDGVMGHEVLAVGGIDEVSRCFYDPVGPGASDLLDLLHHCV